MMKGPKPLKNVAPMVRKALKDSKFVETQAGGDRALLERLVSDLNMKSTWDLVNSRQDEEGVFPLEFLMFAGTLRVEWAAKSKIPTGEAQSALKKLAATTRKVAAKIHAHEAEIIMLAGTRTDLASLIVQVHREAGRQQTVSELEELDRETYRRTNFGHRALPDLVEVLNHLADKLERGAKRKPIGGRPRGARARDAERTFCVQQLAAFFKRNVGTVPITDIARTVSVILDLDDPLTPNHAAKLLTS